MDENNVSYIAYESTMSRLERTNRRFFIIIVILIVALIGTNSAWIYYESQFEDVVVTQEVQAESDNGSDINLNTVGGDYHGRSGEGEADG